MASKSKVLVVGAGPAGTSAAFFLKHFDKKGEFEVTLIDRLPEEKYYKYHRMCGEGISADAFKELKPLKPTNIIHKISLTEEIYPGNVILKTESKGYLLNRSLFLEGIQKKFIKNGGKYENRNVVDFSQKNAITEVVFEDGAKAAFDYIVAADGANSLFRKKLNISGGEFCAEIQYIIAQKIKTNSIKFIYDARYRGDYRWEFPNKSTTKVGFPIFIGESAETPEAHSILEHHTRVIGFGGVNKYCDSNILLVGDSACQTNALSKGGIRPAMVAGRTAAKAIVEKTPKTYEKRWRATDYASPSFYLAYTYLKKLDNSKLSNIAKNILKNKLSKKEMEIAAAFELCNKMGW